MPLRSNSTMTNGIAFVAVALLTWIGTELLKTSSIWQDLVVLAVVLFLVYVFLYPVLLGVSKANDKNRSE